MWLLVYFSFGKCWMSRELHNESFTNDMATTISVVIPFSSAMNTHQSIKEYMSTIVFSFHIHFWCVTVSGDEFKTGSELSSLGSDVAAAVRRTSFLKFKPKTSFPLSYVLLPSLLPLELSIPISLSLPMCTTVKVSFASPSILFSISISEPWTWTMTHPSPK